MAQFVVRDLEDSVKERLKRLAARHNRSMEEEVRAILRDAVKEDRKPMVRLGSRMAARFAGLGLDRDLPELHGEMPRPARFDE